MDSYKDTTERRRFLVPPSEFGRGLHIMGLEGDLVRGWGQIPLYCFTGRSRVIGGRRTRKPFLLGFKDSAEVLGVLDNVRGMRALES